MICFLVVFLSICSEFSSESTSSKKLNQYNPKMLPKLVAFDLDGTIWAPDMYKLWGGGTPFMKTSDPKVLVDIRRTKVTLLGIIDQILHDLHTDPLLKEIKVAWVSRTDEPLWADECLHLFTTSGGVPIFDCAHSSQIFQADKRIHFQNLKKAFPEIEYSEMLFFDNEYGNIESVKKLGVKCCYCPDGMTEAAWREGLNSFN
jgi:magnesium-dependent phosphatase 1